MKDFQGLEMFARYVADYSAAEFRRQIAPILEVCESPIEERMAMALYATLHLVVPFEFMATTGTSIESPPFPDDFKKVVALPQVRVGPYRADFAIIVPRGEAKKRDVVLIECDGHDFHERTKEQAERDRSRDRWMIENGYTCLRFTGAEIWRDASLCAKQIFDVLVSR